MPWSSKQPLSLRFPTKTLCATLRSRLRDTRPAHLNLPLSNPLLIFILIIHSQLIHILVSCFFYSGLPTKIFYAFLSYLIRVEGQAHIIHFHLMMNTNYGCRYYANFKRTFFPSGLYLSNCTQSARHSVYYPRAVKKKSIPITTTMKIINKCKTQFRCIKNTLYH